MPASGGPPRAHAPPQHAALLARRRRTAPAGAWACWGFSLGRLLAHLNQLHLTLLQTIVHDLPPIRARVSDPERRPPRRLYEVGSLPSISAPDSGRSPRRPGNQPDNSTPYIPSFAGRKQRSLDPSFVAAEPAARRVGHLDAQPRASRSFRHSLHG